jgi:hypothetical protein
MFDVRYWRPCKDENVLSLVAFGKKENILDHSSIFERMKMSKGGFGAWNLR